jgi:hypothetical protein
MSPIGGQLGECSGVKMWRGIEVCLEESQNFPCLIQYSRLVSEQSEQSVNNVPSLSKEQNKEKQRNMDSILYIIDEDQITF